MIQKGCSEQFIDIMCNGVVQIVQKISFNGKHRIKEISLINCNVDYSVKVTVRCDNVYTTYVLSAGESKIIANQTNDGFIVMVHILLLVVK